MSILHFTNDSDHLDAASVYDSAQGKTQDEINAGKVNTSDYNPTQKTSAMTNPVGKDANGGLWTTPVASADIVSATENWLNENITQETGYVIDGSFSTAGAAADAKATGDKILEQIEPTILATNDLALDKKRPLPAIFMRGGLKSTSPYFDLEKTSRVSTATYVTVESDTTFFINSGYSVRCYSFNKETGAFISAGSWTTDSVTLSANNKKYLITISATPSDDSITADVRFYAKQVYTPMKNLIDDDLKYAAFSLPVPSGVPNNLYKIDYGINWVQGAFTSEGESDSTFWIKTGEINGGFLYHNRDGENRVFVVQINVSTRALSYYNEENTADEWFYVPYDDRYKYRLRQRKATSSTAIIPADNNVIIFRPYDTLPDYYFDNNYITGKVNTINKRSTDLPINSDSFIFITDYHSSRNTGNSPALIKYIVKNTGISTLIFGGDAYGTLPSTGARTGDESRNIHDIATAKVYNILQDCAPNFFSVMGNHEWNRKNDREDGAQAGDFEDSANGAYTISVKRHELQAKEMTEEGNYYVDNISKKVRYFFIQENGIARVTDSTLEWLANKLNDTPEDFGVIGFVHYAYIAGDLEDGNSFTVANRNNAKQIPDLFNAFDQKISFTSINNAVYNFNNSNGYVIAIFSGHTHTDRGEKIPLNSNLNSNFYTISTASDTYRTGSSEEIYTFENEKKETITRNPMTIYEQAFDVVQIDLDTKTIYMTRIGGGIDRKFPSSENSDS